MIPSARSAGVVGALGDRLKVRVSAPAESGKANRAVLELLARELGLPVRDLEIVSGHSNRDKTLRVRAALDFVEEKLRAES